MNINLEHKWESLDKYKDTVESPFPQTWWNTICPNSSAQQQAKAHKLWRAKLEESHNSMFWQQETFPTAPFCSFFSPSHPLCSLFPAHDTWPNIDPKDQTEKKNLPAKSIHYFSIFKAKYCFTQSPFLLFAGPPHWKLLQEYFSLWHLATTRMLSRAGQHVLSPPTRLARLKTLNTHRWSNDQVVLCDHPVLIIPQSLLSTDCIWQVRDVLTQRWESRLPKSNLSSDNYMLHSPEQLLKSSWQGLLTCRMVAIVLFSQQSSE